MAETSRILGENYTASQADSLGDFSYLSSIESNNRQPMHTLYGGAHLFKRDSLVRFQSIMNHYRTTYLPYPESLMLLLEMSGRGIIAEDAEQLINETFHLICSKIDSNPVEDYRIDFEDGYGCHTDDDENAAAQFAANEAAIAFAESLLPNRFGTRIKSLSGSTRKRALDTLDIFISTFLDASAGKLPKGFVITLPKITRPDEVELLCETLSEIEFRAGLKLNTIKIELMVEEPALLSDEKGNSQLLNLLKSGFGRTIGLHIGIYDYLSALGVPAGFQIYTHPFVNDLRGQILLSTNSFAVDVVDGVTNTLPVEIHRGKDLSPDRKDENKQIVFKGWSEHLYNVTESLKYGILQGWDIHPAQCIARYIAVYIHLLEGRDSTIQRMKRFISDAAKPGQSKGVFDDAATIRGLLVYLGNAANNGVITDAHLIGLNLTKAMLDLPSVEILKRIGIL